MADFMKGVMVLKKSGDELIEVDAGEALQGKVVAILFSAGWCGPCRQFTPKLLKFYETCKAAGKPLEIVWASKDRAKSDLEEYFKEKHGDWLALPYGDDQIAKYQTKFDIKTIPLLRVIKSDGTMVVQDGRADINEKAKDNPLGVFDKWEKACK